MILSEESEQQVSDLPNMYLVVYSQVKTSVDPLCVEDVSVDLALEREVIIRSFPCRRS
jgi:hypothetical protein